MQKVIVSIPDDLIDRMKAVIPPRQRSKILTKLLEDEVKTREAKLYQCARKVESDQSLNAEMEDWNATIGDGIDDLRMKNEKVEDKLFNVTVFFIKASTKLTLAETIRKAQRLISQVDEEIKPGRGFANRTLKQHKIHVENLINVQKRSIEVFDTQERAEGWLRSPSIALGWKAPMELMISDKGIEMVLNELVRIEHGIVS